MKANMFSFLIETEVMIKAISCPDMLLVLGFREISIPQKPLVFS